MKKLIVILFLCIPFKSFALDDGDIIHTNQLIKETKILLSSTKPGDIFLASSLMSVYLMDNPEDKEAIELNAEINRRMKVNP